MEWKIVNKDELYHHQKKGAHWGVMNGPPYPLDKEGKARFAESVKRERKKEQAEEAKKSKAGGSKGSFFEQNIRGGKDKPKQSKAEVTAKETKKIIDNTKDIVRDVGRMTKKEQTYDVSKMSDQELRNKINRMSMEKQYNQLMREKNYVKTGSEKVVDMLNVVGSVAAIGVSAATIVSLVKGLKK